MGPRARQGQVLEPHREAHVSPLDSITDTAVPRRTSSSQNMETTVLRGPLKLHMEAQVALRCHVEAPS
jgi:hypothetical protein